MAEEKLTVDEVRKKIARGELTAEEALRLVDKGKVVQVNPEQKKSTAEPKRRVASSGKEPTVEDLEKEREVKKADIKRLTAEIEKKKREQKRQAEKAAREKEQRDALEWYRKYRDYIEMAKQLELQSGKTAFEWIESEIAKAKENGNQKA